ncbi:MAG: hypothetical protein ACJ71O_08185 [Nitrososphaeraceae archaeon]
MDYKDFQSCLSNAEGTKGYATEKEVTVALILSTTLVLVAAAAVVAVVIMTITHPPLTRIVHSIRMDDTGRK